MKRAERRRRRRAEDDDAPRDRYPWLPKVALVVVTFLALVGAWVIATDRMPPCGGKPAPCLSTRTYPEAPVFT